jgi:hypothetical protein
MNPEVLTEIKVALAEIKVNTENTMHRVRNIEQRLDAYVPRHEIKITHDALENRVKDLEEGIKWAYRSIVGLVITVIGSSITLGITIAVRGFH